MNIFISVLFMTYFIPVSLTDLLRQCGNVTAFHTCIQNKIKPINYDFEKACYRTHHCNLTAEDGQAFQKLLNVSRKCNEDWSTFVVRRDDCIREIYPSYYVPIENVPKPGLWIEDPQHYVRQYLSRAFVNIACPNETMVNNTMACTKSMATREVQTQTSGTCTIVRGCAKTAFLDSCWGTLRKSMFARYCHCTNTTLFPTMASEEQKLYDCMAAGFLPKTLTKKFIGTRKKALERQCASIDPCFQ